MHVDPLLVTGDTQSWVYKGCMLGQEMVWGISHPSPTLTLNVHREEKRTGSRAERNSPSCSMTWPGESYQQCELIFASSRHTTSLTPSLPPSLPPPTHPPPTHTVPLLLLSPSLFGYLLPPSPHLPPSVSLHCLLLTLPSLPSPPAPTKSIKF